VLSPYPFGTQENVSPSKNVDVTGSRRHRFTTSRAFPGSRSGNDEVMAYRVFVTDGQVYEFPDHAAMVIDGSDYVFVVGDEEISRLACDDVRDVEDSPA
jgi:hypothetical protein